MTQSTLQIPQTLDYLAKLCTQEASALRDATTRHLFTLELHLKLSTKIFSRPPAQASTCIGRVGGGGGGLRAGVFGPGGGGPPSILFAFLHSFLMHLWGGGVALLRRALSPISASCDEVRSFS